MNNIIPPETLGKRRYHFPVQANIEFINGSKFVIRTNISVLAFNFKEAQEISRKEFPTVLARAFESGKFNITKLTIA